VINRIDVESITEQRLSMRSHDYSSESEISPLLCNNSQEDGSPKGRC
jgi:hypothetical protein